MKRLKATSVLVMLLLSGLVLLAPAPAAAETEPMDLLTTTDRTVLVELFTGANSLHCIEVNNGLEDFLDDHNRNQVAALLYHRPIPSADKLSTFDTADRQEFYVPAGEPMYAPEFVVDGTIYNVGPFTTSAEAQQEFEDQYTTQSANKSQLSIEVDAQIAPSMYGQVWVNVTALEVLDYANLYLTVVVVRKYYGPWDGGNGLVDHIYTVRMMLPDSDGGAFVVSSGQTISRDFEFNLANDGDLSAYDDMAVVAFVQTHSKNTITSGGSPENRSIAAILQSGFADVRTIPNVAPVLSSGYVDAPPRLTQDDELTFKVLYADADDIPDTGPSDVMVHFKNETNEVLQHTLAPIPSANLWTEGRWLTWTTRLDPGIYSYRFTGSDGFDDATGDTEWNATTFMVKPRNKVPQLMDHGYTPLHGDTNTVFRFDIMYRDEDNEQAVSAKIYINAVPYEMQTTSTGPWNDWNVYFYETTLSVGENHKFFFVFNDGYDDRRYPPANDSPNWHSGPEVTRPNIEPSLTTALFDPDKGTRKDEFTFTIIYTDGDDDRPSRSFIYIDGTPFIMDGDGDDYGLGVTYRYRSELDLGPHQVHYIFSDGKHEVRYPPLGEIEGPLVINMVPLAVIAAPANAVRYTPDDYISFSSIGSQDPEDDELAYIWVSNIDGQLSTLPLTENILSEGDHIITLTVTDEYGGEHSTSISVLVKARLAEPYIVDYLRTPDSPKEADLVKYTVVLNNRGEKAATDLEVSFLVDNTYVGSVTTTVAEETNVEVKFTWEAVTGEHAITFEIAGDDLTFTEYVTANSVPTTNPQIVNTPDGKERYKVDEELYFKASATDGDDDDLTFHWDFSGGATSTQENPSHVYAKAGTYPVVLTVKDTRGGEKVDIFEVVVKEPEVASNGGIGGPLMIVGLILIVLVVIIGIAFVMIRDKGGEPAKAAPAPEEPRPDVPDYLMPDPKPSTPEEPKEPEVPEEPEYADYSNGIPEEQPSEDGSDDGYLGY